MGEDLSCSERWLALADPYRDEAASGGRCPDEL